MKNSVFKSEAGKEAVLSAYKRILADWPVEHKQYQITTGNIATHIIESGPENAPVVVLLHGTSSNAASWMGSVVQWSRYFRVLAIDVPGQPGLSQDCRLEFAGDGYASWLSAVLDALSIGRVRIIGMSLGSWIAIKFAITYPHMVEKLSLLTTSGIVAPRASFFFKVIPLMFLGKYGISRINKIIYYKTIIPQEVDDFSSLIMKHFKQVTEPVPIFKDEELQLLRMPLQYFGGLNDALLDSKATAQRIKHVLPGADIRLLDETGHVIINQDAEIMDFLLDENRVIIMNKDEKNNY